MRLQALSGGALHEAMLASMINCLEFYAEDDCVQGAREVSLVFSACKLTSLHENSQRMSLRTHFAQFAGRNAKDAATSAESFGLNVAIEKLHRE